MKRRKTKKVKMVRVLGETVRKGSKSHRILLAERRHFLRRQRDPNSSYYGVPISDLLKSNRRRGLRRNQGEGEREEMLKRLREFREKRLKKPSTSFEYIVQGYYPGSGWEDLTTADNRWEAIQDRKAYDENERQYVHRLIKRRIKKISTNRRRGLRRNPGTAKARPIPGMFYSIWFSGRGGQTTKLVVKGEILKKASIANLSRMFPYFEVSKLQKLHTAGPYNSFDEAFLNR